MKHYLLFVFGIFFIIACNNNEPEKENTSATTTTATEDSKGKIIDITGKETDTSKKSIKAYVSGNINGRQITISYHSPAVRNRIIWGGLVPFDQPWVSGAHMATSIETDATLILNGQEIPAGKYAFFTIPYKKDWTIILNKNWDQHLTDAYDAKDDILRWQVKPDSLSFVQERLRYTIDQLGEYKGRIDLTWEKLRIAIPFEVKR